MIEKERITKYLNHMDRDKEFNNLTALQNFQDCIENKTEYSNGGYSFKVIVEYFADGITVKDVMDAEIYLVGYDKFIRLDPGNASKKIPQTSYHKDFYTRFKNVFSFNEQDRSLIITDNNTPKFKHYKVTITELQL